MISRRAQALDNRVALQRRMTAHWLCGPLTGLLCVVVAWGIITTMVRQL